MPATLAELKADGRLSFVTYLERFGGYSQNRDLALVMHQLAFIADCLVQDDVHGAREHLGLLLASTEQAAQDPNWSLAFDPPMSPRGAGPQVFSSRAQGTASRLRAFTPLVSAAWGSTALSCVRELDTLAQTRKDTVLPKQQQGHHAPDEAALPTTTEGPTTTAMSLPTPPPTSSEPTSLALRTPADVPPCRALALPLQPCPLPWPRHFPTPSAAMRSNLLNASLSRPVL